MTNTPALATALFGMMAALAALLIRLEVLVEMMSIGESVWAAVTCEQRTGQGRGGLLGERVDRAQGAYGAPDKEGSWAAVGSRVQIGNDIRGWKSNQACAPEMKPKRQLAESIGGRTCRRRWSPVGASCRVRAAALAGPDLVHAVP